MSMIALSLKVERFAKKNDKPFIAFATKELTTSYQYDQDRESGSHAHFVTTSVEIGASDLMKDLTDAGYLFGDAQMIDEALTWEGVYPGYTLRYAVLTKEGQTYYIHHAVDYHDEPDEAVHHIEVLPELSPVAEYREIPTFGEFLRETGRDAEIRKLLDEHKSKH